MAGQLAATTMWNTLVAGDKLSKQTGGGDHDDAWHADRIDEHVDD